MKVKRVIYPLVGLATYIPGFESFLALTGPTNHARFYITGVDGSTNPRYCYTTLLRHLVRASQSGLSSVPATIAELGPGSSIGFGLAALLAGSEKYFALDALEHASLGHNLEVFDSLVELFTGRVALPADDEFPDVKPKLSDYSFPEFLFPGDSLSQNLHPERLRRIRLSIENTRSADSMVVYQAPWDDGSVIQPESVDVIFSQAVLEHVVDLPRTYEKLAEWLKPGGLMSHQIDFRSHGIAEEWNGHWTYSPTVWKMIQGSRPYLLNRETCSTHIRLHDEHGFRVIDKDVFQTESFISPQQLAVPFKRMKESDLVTSGLFVQSIKKSRT